MQRLMTLDVSQRLGANGANEVKAHPFFQGIEWNRLATSEVAFTPQISDPKSTKYSDQRGKERPGTVHPMKEKTFAYAVPAVW
jgi:serine/threonine-protein kinase RIM15